MSKQSSEHVKSRRPSLSRGRKELKEIIQTCEAIAQRKFNPFFMDVKLGVNTLREYFPGWTQFDDHCLDAHAINRLSEVVRLQNTQLKFQSSALYSDPEFLVKKLERMSEKRLSEVFLESWHPVAELEQLTNVAVEGALGYWNLLSPIAERWKRRDHARGKEPEKTDEGTLTGLGIHGEEFSQQTNALWEELRELFRSEGKPIDYWKFVKKVEYSETVHRAYLTSYLITYGYAKLIIEDNKLSLQPLEQPTRKAAPDAISFPISVPKGG